MNNKLNLPTDKIYYDFIGIDGESAGIACFNNSDAAQKTLKQLQKNDYLFSRIVIKETQEAIKTINKRAAKNDNFPLDEGDTFFNENLNRKPIERITSL